MTEIIGCILAHTSTGKTTTHGTPTSVYIELLGRHLLGRDENCKAVITNRNRQHVRPKYALQHCILQDNGTMMTSRIYPESNPADKRDPEEPYQRPHLCFSVELQKQAIPEFRFNY